jgi:hypothetical protein
VNCPDILLGVNGSGMWNTEITTDFVMNTIAKRYETAVEKEHVILIMDSYGSHKNLDVGYLERNFNLHVVFIAGRMTSILQPLDVGINRAYQQYYNDRYDEFLQVVFSKNKDNPTYYTPKGNPKCPSYQQVREWSNDFAKTFDKQKVKKAFQVCDIGCSKNFEMFHSELKEVLTPGWKPKEPEDLKDEYDDFDFGDIFDDRKFLCCSNLFHALSHWVDDTPEAMRQKVTKELQENKILKDIVDSHMIENLSLGSVDGVESSGKNELYAFSVVHPHLRVVLFDTFWEKIYKYGLEGNVTLLAEIGRDHINDTWYIRK